MTSFKTGLIVGKFCPLHKGHEYLIETALKSCDRLVIISYANPEYPRCESHLRRRWLRELYPDAISLVVDDAWLAEQSDPGGYDRVPHDGEGDHVHRLFTSWLSHTVLRETVDVVFTSEDYGDGFADVLSDYQSSLVRHVCVDKARDTVPISATRIRQDPSRFRSYLSDVVYGSLIRKAVFLGGESSGKSTLCRLLADRLQTQYAHEYGRELWEQKNGNLVFDDMLHIAKTQIERERSLALSAVEWLFCDTSPLTTMFYSEDSYGKVAPELEALSRRSYDTTFLCCPDFDFVQDGTRQGDAFRMRQHDWYVNMLTDRKVDYIELKGSPEARLQTVLGVLESQETLTVRRDG